jgi:hypothetical protein
MSVTNSGRGSKNQKSGPIQIDAELFLLAVRSYPERFCHQPAVSFEQHFLSLVVASNVVASNSVAPRARAARAGY